MDSQLKIENELESGLRNFENRVKRSGLILWSRVFLKKLFQIREARKSKEKIICAEIVKLEEIARECESPDSSAKLLKKIHEIKGLVCVGCLILLCLNMLQLSFNGIRTRSSGSRVQIVRITRKREDSHG